MTVPAFAISGNPTKPNANHISMFSKTNKTKQRQQTIQYVNFSYQGSVYGDLTLRKNAIIRLGLCLAHKTRNYIPALYLPNGNNRKTQMSFVRKTSKNAICRIFNCPPFPPNLCLWWFSLSLLQFNFKKLNKEELKQV